MSLYIKQKSKKSTENFRGPRAFSRCMMSLPCFGVTRMVNKERKKILISEEEKKTNQNQTPALKHQIMSKLWEEISATLSCGFIFLFCLPIFWVLF